MLTKFDKIYAEAIEDDFQITGNPKKVSKDLKKIGVTAVTNSYGDEDSLQIVSIKDPGKFKGWLSKNGWDKQDVEDSYPEIYKQVYENLKSFALVVSEAQSEYDEFFKGKLKKYGVSSPDELSDEDKKKFFQEIEDEWTKEDN